MRNPSLVDESAFMKFMKTSPQFCLELSWPDLSFEIKSKTGFLEGLYRKTKLSLELGALVGSSSQTPEGHDQTRVMGFRRDRATFIDRKITS